MLNSTVVLLHACLTPTDGHRRCIKRKDGQRNVLKVLSLLVWDDGALVGLVTELEGPLPAQHPCMSTTMILVFGKLRLVNKQHGSLQMADLMRM